jgi:hypothetical protein
MSIRADGAAFDFGEDFRERVFDDREAESGNFFEAVPTAGDESFLIADEGGVELALVEWAVDDHRLEVVSDDVLRERRVAADVALFGRVEDFGIEQADHIAQIQIAIGELGHVLAADVAEIAFVAFGHS